MRDDYPRFQTAGGDVVVVTMGTPDQTAAFRDRNRLPFVCLADPERLAYRAFGVPRGTLNQVAGPTVWAGGLKALVRAGVGKPIGDVLQLHGTFVIDTGGVIRFAHLPKHSADRPTNGTLIKQLAACSM